MQVKYSKISRFQIKKIMKCFSQDLTAIQTAWLLEYNRNTINKYYNLFRETIYNYQSELYEKLKMEWLVEVDESYFWEKRIRWYRWKLKRWRWTRKQPVFWILKRDGKVYTEIIPNCTTEYNRKQSRTRYNHSKWLMEMIWLISRYVIWQKL